MKSAAGILSLVLFASSVALAGDRATLDIDHNPETVRDVAIFVLMQDGYSISTQGPTTIVFVKETKRKARFSVLNLLSSPGCAGIQPRVYLTLNLSPTDYGTRASISAMAEYTELIQYERPATSWSLPRTYTSCETVREVPVLMRSGKMLTNLLQDIESRTMALPRESVSHTLSADR